MKNYKTTIIGILSGLMAIIAASHHTSFLDAVKDMQVQMSVIGLVLGVLSKDYDSHATTTVEVQSNNPPKLPTTTVEVKE